MTKDIVGIQSKPLATIVQLVQEAQQQVQRIVESVMEKSALSAEVSGVLETTGFIREKLTALKTDEEDCTQLLARLSSTGYARMPEFAGLSDEETTQRRATLLSRLRAHLVRVRKSKATLERGLELSRASMVNRFATYAVAGLSEDGTDTMISGRAFMVAYLVAANLKDRLETAGFRWAGEKTLITLYLNAVGCERRRSKDRFVADPIASVVATRTGFRSAMELHQALFALHNVTAGGGAADDLGHVQFDQAPCAAFAQNYQASSTLQTVFEKVMQRARTGPLAH